MHWFALHFASLGYIVQRVRVHWALPLFFPIPSGQIHIRVNHLAVPTLVLSTRVTSIPDQRVQTLG